MEDVGSDTTNRETIAWEPRREEVGEVTPEE